MDGHNPLKRELVQMCPLFEGSTVVIFFFPCARFPQNQAPQGGASGGGGGMGGPTPGGQLGDDGDDDLYS